MLGFEAAPAATAPVDPFDAALVNLVRTQEKLVKARAMGLIADNGQGTSPQQPVPPAATLTEAVHAAAAVAEIHKGAAETARSLADLERERRKEAEERASGAFEAGQEEAESRWSTVLQIVQENNRTVLELIKDKHAAEVAAERSRAEQIAERMEQSNKQAVEVLTKEIARRDEEISRLRQENSQLSQRETFDQALTRAILGQAPEKVQLLERLFGRKDEALTPEQEANRIWLKGQAEKRLEAMTREEDRKDAMHEEVRGLVGELRGVLTHAKAYLPLLAGVPRMPGSAVPGEWPQNGVAEGGSEE